MAPQDDLTAEREKVKGLEGQYQRAYGRAQATVEALQRERDDAEGRFQATFNAYAELKAALTPVGGGQDGNATVR